MRTLSLPAALALAALVAGCSLGPRLIIDRQPDVTGPGAVTRGGGYYKDDGPGDNPPDLAAIAEPEPRVEPLHRFANNPYNVFGVAYRPQKALTPFKQRGVGSWYGRKFNGQRTSSGEPYNMYAMTAAHPTLPIPSYARVTNVGNGTSVIVRINDRGPFHSGRIIDLSYTAAWKLGYVATGSTPVEVELLTPELIAQLGARRGAPAPASTQALAQTPAPATALAENVTERSPQPLRAQALPAVAVASQPLAMEAGSGGVFLQLAAFSGRDNAESFRARVYRELGWLNDAIEILQRDGLFRLHLGPYRDRAEAGSMAERLRNALELRPMVVVR